MPQRACLYAFVLRFPTKDTHTLGRGALLLLVFIYFFVRSRIPRSEFCVLTKSKNPSVLPR